VVKRSIRKSISGRPYCRISNDSSLNRLFALAVIILLLTGAVGCPKPEVDSKPDSTTTVILIRHVERDNFFIVTAQGHQRAQPLVDAVGDRGIRAIYSPDLERNLDTVKPLAKHLGIDITLTPRINKQTANKIVDEILAGHPGEAVLLVGNGAGNLRLLHQRLGGTGEGPYQYGELYIYTIPAQGTVKVIKSRYGS
jgi:hypothetical protein